MINCRRPLFWCAVFFMLGITAGYYFSINRFFIILLFLLLVLSANYIMERKIYIIIMVLALFGGFIWMFSAEYCYTHEKSIIHWHGKGQVLVKGEVIQDLSSLTGSNIYLKPYEIDDCEVKYGLIQLNKDYLPTQFKNGEVLRIKLELKSPEPVRNPGGFSYKKYLKKKGIYSIGYYSFDTNTKNFQHINYKIHFLKNYLIKLKRKLLYLIDIAVNEPDNEIIKALVLGERENLPVEWKDKFSQAGASHLLAISGLHVGFIMLIFVFIFQLLFIEGKWRNILCTFLMVTYILITGLRASVLRAGLLGCFFLWAPFWERRGDILNICGFTIIITLVINPYQLFTAGFQLTYLVLFMIIFWADIIKNNINKIIAVSAAAQLGSFPITTYYFNLISPAGLITNIWAIPLVAVIVLAAIIALLLGLVHPAFALASGSILNMLLPVLKKGIAFMSILPCGYLEVPSLPVILILLLYSCLFSLPIILKNNILPFEQKKKKREILFVCIIIIFSLLIFIILPIFNNNLQLVFLYVGQGDSILIQGPNGKTFLIDAGNDSGGRKVLSYLKTKGIKKIDIVFITHFDTDHAGGMPKILKNRKIGMLILPEKIPGNLQTEIAEEIMKTTSKKKIPVKFAGSGDKLKYNKIILEILNPDINDGLSGRNDNSLVMKLKYRNFSALLTGDLEYDGEMLFLHKNYKIKSHVIKLGHHGSSSSSSSLFLKEVDPQIGIISVGKNNYGHPAPEVIERLKDLDINIYRTDRDGAVTITTDGQKYWVKKFIK